jgi:hypothetical protein
LVIDRSGSYLWAAAFAGCACVAGFFILIPLRAAPADLALGLAEAD